MRITDVKAHIFTPMKLISRNTGPFSLIDWSRLAWGMGDSALVRIFTDKGVVGHSKTSPDTAEYMVMNKSELDNVDPFDRLKLEKSFRWTNDVVTALDIYLWDIAGQALGLPIYKFLGAYREKILAYASFIQLPTEKAYLQIALECKRNGYKAIKIHPYWGSDWKRDIALCTAIREAVGDEMILMLDPVQAYDRWSAMKVGRAIDKLNFYWYEDPISKTDLTAYANLCKSLDVAITEAEGMGLHTLAEYIRRDATDILRCSLEGGITGVMKAGHLAEAFNIKCELHSWGCTLDQVAVLHAMLAMENCDFFELPVPEGIMDQVSKDVIRIDEKGYVHAPKAPGLGLEVDFDAIDVDDRHIHRVISI